jgi:4-hydroxy-2-oxoglutarate aldolase
MANKTPRGVFAPVATIFDTDGSIDSVRFTDNIQFYASSPLDGVVLLGSNGEFATLDMDERRRVIELGTEAINGRKVVMAGTGAESTRGTIELTKAAAAAGVDYALIVTPHYYKTRYDQKAYVNHYLKVAEASPVPILIYVMAAYTSVDLPTPIVLELAGHPNIVGLKDSGGNAAKVGEIIAGARSDFAVLAGSANFLYAALCLGATGGILALGNIAPAECAQIYADFQAGNHDAARELQLQMIAPNAAVTSKFGIAGLKAALDWVGLNGGIPREPLLPLTAAEHASLVATLDTAGIGKIVAAATA